MVIPATHEETPERALGWVGDPFLLVERGEATLLEWDLAAWENPGGDRVAEALRACRPEDSATSRSRKPTGSGVPASRGASG